MKDLGPTLLRMDDALVKRGILPLSDRWRAELSAWYSSGAPVHAVEAGRSSAKSVASAKGLTCETVFGGWKVPAGERHWAINVSVSHEEAKARLGQIEAYLRALEEPFERSGDQVLLTNRPLGFWSRAARIGALSGPRVVAWAVDEAAKLSDDTGANPAAELVASLKAASAYHPGARGRVYSSPWTTSGYHFDLIQAGTTRRTYVSRGPTWEWAPWITEAQTREIEDDERVWRREYAAIPMPAASAAFDEDAIDRIFTPRVPADVVRVHGSVQKATPVLILDPSSGRKDAWTWAIASWAIDDRGPFLYVDTIGARKGAFWRQTSASEVVAELVALARSRGVSRVFADQREAFMLESAFQEEGFSYTPIAWTNANKIEAVEGLRRHMREGTLHVIEHDDLRRELRAFEEKPTPSGSFTFAGRRSGDDHVALLITLLLADRAHGLERAYADSPTLTLRDLLANQPRSRTVHAVGGRSTRLV